MRDGYLLSEGCPDPTGRLLEKDHEIDGCRSAKRSRGHPLPRTEPAAETPALAGGLSSWTTFPREPQKEQSGAQEQTTNNQMELQAVIQGLAALKRSTRVHIVTDSSYVQQGITNWIHGWKQRGWRRKTSNGLRPVKNVELWQELDRLTGQHNVSFELVRGHSGHAMNERCDELAVQAYLELTGRPPRK